MKPTISGMLIAFAVISLLTVALGYFMVELNNNYGQNIDNYDQIDLSAYNNLERINNDSIDLKNDTVGIKTGTSDPSALDAASLVVGGAFGVLKGVGNTVDIAEGVTDQALEDANAGELTETIRTFVLVFFMITIFLGIIVTAVLKWEV